ncbi:MAG TPA: hypothetical protein VGP24_14470 [Glaciihabitans sp.]|jgi:hypothetical protein|nr:hypothetical protein [Glaciihabitans sp.]
MSDETTDTSGGRRARRGQSRRRTRIFVAVSLAVVLLTVGGTVAFHSMQASAQTEFDAQYSDFLERQTAASGYVDSAEAVVATAQITLDDSAGKVFSEDPRAALAETIADATREIDKVTEQISEASAAAESFSTSESSPLTPGSALREGAVVLAEFSTDTAESLVAVETDLNTAIAAVVTETSAWQVEQDRIIASRYTNHVHAAGWIAELDQCIGSVDLSARYGVDAIAEHWSCGGREFPDTAGEIITLTGVREGTYRVEGIVKTVNQRTATFADVPRGYDLVYQTCQNGQSSTMSFTALTKLD